MGQGRLTWQTLIDRHGLESELIRLGEPNITLSVKMMRRFAEEDGLERELSQQDAWFIVEYAKLEAAAFPLPPKKNDRIRSLNKLYTVFLVEPKISHNEIVGYQMRCKG